MADTTAPRLTSFTLPQSVDVRTMQNYTFAVNATDDDSGVFRVDLLFDKTISPRTTDPRALRFDDSVESFTDGTSLLSTPLSTGLGAERYTVVGAILTDKAGNISRLDAGQIAATGSPTSFDVLSNAVIDPDLPRLTGLNIPANLSFKSPFVVITGTATDATSGIESIRIDYDRPLFVSASSGIASSGYFISNGNPGQKIVGDAFTARSALSQADRFGTRIEPGERTITGVTVYDKYGNANTYDTAQLNALGINTRVSLTNDDVPPTVIDITGPATIREGDGSFALTFTGPWGSTIADINISVDASSIARNGTDVGILSTAYRATNPQDRGAIDIATISGLGILNDAAVEGVEKLVLRVQAPGYRFADGTDTKLVSINILDNDGNGGDLLWFQPGLRQFTTWQPDGAGFRYGSFTSAPLDAGVRPTGQYDFTGDGRQDVLLQTAEGNVVSVMRATAAGGYEQFGMTGAMEAGWRIAGIGDLTGDGRADILFRRGEGLSVATSDGATLRMKAVTTSGPTADWHLAAFDDFNGDGRDDILWRSENGTNALWYRTGDGFDRFGPQSVVDRGWHVEGSGDFNGDGRADLVWRNDNGALVIWAAQDGGFDRGFYGNTVGAEWSLDGVQDFNADGRADLVWRTPWGELSVWQWTGSGFSTFIDPKGPSAASWTIPQQTLDFI